jgi:hypothetical protein
MPIVFVHGVNTRKTEAGYSARLGLIDRFVQKHLAGAMLGGLAVTSLSPAFPYWGDLATTFAWNMASLPTGHVNALGPMIDDSLRPLIAALDDDLSNATTAKQQPLLTLATRKTLPHAVDIISDLLLQTATENEAVVVADFIVAAHGYAESNPSPSWLGTLTTDEQLLNRLVVEAKASAPAAVQALGVLDRVLNPLAAAGAKLKAAMQSAATTILDRSGDFASTKLLAWQRKPLNETLGRFFGDIFIYLDKRGDKAAPGPIPKLIMDAIDTAKVAGPAHEPLIVIGHSLGGVICFDLFGHFRPELTVDLFVTVGSQVSHFEEIKQLKTSNLAIRAPQKAPTPVNIKHWINIFDEVDIFSYACDQVFDRVIDFEYDTQTYVIKAHGAYFEQDRFYSRLRARIDAL